MVHIVIYSMRGYIAFVAFIELGNAIRCFMDEEKFLNQGLFNNTMTDTEAIKITARLLGRYYLLNCLIIGHCALFIQHLPVISLTIGTLAMSIFLHGSEAFYYYTAEVSFYVVFPILVSFSTIVCLLIAPMFFEQEKKKKKIIIQEDEEDEDEETKIIKQKQAQTLSNLSGRAKKTQ